MNLRVLKLGTVAVLAILAAAAHGMLGQERSGEREPSLYERLGGLAPISVVVDEFIDELVADDLLNQNPAIDAARERVPAPYLKYHVTAMVCEATGGPCRYHGRGMEESHAHLNITEREWARMVEILQGVLDEHDVPAREAGELLRIVESTKADIVADGAAAGGGK